MSARDGIARTNAEFTAAIAAANAAGVAACYTEDGWFMVPGMPTMVGRDALTALFQGFLDQGITRVELITTEVFDEGDSAVEVGEYKLFAGDAQADHGRFLVRWRNVDGKWLLHRDMINSLGAPG